MTMRNVAAVGRRVVASGAIALVLAGAGGTAAAATLPAGSVYSTAMRLSGEGLPLSFEGVSHRAFPADGPIELGRFVVSRPDRGGDVNFNNTSFAVEFNRPYEVGVDASDPAGTLSKTTMKGVFAIEGRLNGTVFADGSSNLKATLDRVSTDGLDASSSDGLPFSIGDVKVAPEIDLGAGPGGTSGVSLAAQLVGGTTDAVTATPLAADVVTTQQIPEPSTMAIFLVAACGLAARHRRRA